MYSLKIITWENDADNYNTHELRTEDREYVKMIIEIASLFRSEYSSNASGLFGNSRVSGYNEESKVDKAVAAIIQKYQNANVDVKDWYIKEDGWHFDFYDLLVNEAGINTWNDGEYWRVFESFKVEILPSDIRDVTEEFKAELKGD